MFIDDIRFHINVSIHASVKDATFVISDKSLLPEVSIHASVKDATISPPPIAAGLWFQSTHL